MNSLVDAVVLAAACGTMLAYLCRLDLLLYGLPHALAKAWRGHPRAGHKAAIILLHQCLACAVIFAGKEAWIGESGPLHAFAVAGAALWIVVSFSGWRTSVPAHWDSGPMPLEEARAEA